MLAATEPKAFNLAHGAEGQRGPRGEVAWVLAVIRCGLMANRADREAGSPGEACALACCNANRAIPTAVCRPLTDYSGFSGNFVIMKPCCSKHASAPLYILCSLQGLPFGRSALPKVCPGALSLDALLRAGTQRVRDICVQLMLLSDRQVPARV